MRLNIHDQAAFELQTLIGVSNTPEFYRFDPLGKILRKWDEAVDLAEWEQTIQALPTRGSRQGVKRFALKNTRPARPPLRCQRLPTR